MLSDQMPPSIRPKTHLTRPGRPISLLMSSAVLAFLATLLLLMAACRSADQSLTPLPGTDVRAGQQVDFMAAATPLAVAVTSSGFVPAAFGSPLDPTPTPTPTPSPTPPTTLGPPLPPPTPVVAVPPIDFDAAREAAQAKGLDLAHVKIGFHTGPGGNHTGIGDYFRKLNDAGVPIFLKSVDDPGKILELQQIMSANRAADRFVPHTMVYRLTDARYEDPFYNYATSPEQAAAISWELNRSNWSTSLDKSMVWFETLNEPGRIGRNGVYHVDRLGRFSLATAKLAVAQGYRYAAFSWEPGQPEPEDWEQPEVLEFLRYAAEHPDQVAVALHEYSLSPNYIVPPAPTEEGDPPAYPYAVGRFQALFAVCDKYGIPRPTVLITEWGWAFNALPEPEAALQGIAWASWLYAAYPTVKGAAIWYLGRGTDGIHNQTQRLIAPLADYAVSHYYLYDPGLGQIDAELFRPQQPTLLNPQLSDNWPTPIPRPGIMP